MAVTPDSTYLVVSLFAAGMGVIFFWTDRASPPSRALAYCLLAIGARLLVGAFDDDLTQQDGGRWTLSMAAPVLEVIAMIAGIGWARRIGKTAEVPLRTAAQWLFYSAQILVLLYGVIALTALALRPDAPVRELAGLAGSSTLEFALLIPVLAASMLCAGIATLMLLLNRIDRAERVRLLAALFAAPFLISAIFVGQGIVPITVSIGLLIFLFGSVRYLMVQGQRGEFMSQFLSPEVARMVRSEGIKKALRRQRRPLSIVVCDLRGFTAFARTHDSRVVTDVLEAFYDVVGGATETHGGTVKDHAGDGVLILVGAPIPVRQHARQAVFLALEVRARTQEVLREMGVELGVGIGIATGKTTVGAIRGAGRFEYVAVGTAVNLAARLCDRAENGEILVDQRTADALQPEDAVSLTHRDPERLKGFTDPVPVVALGVDTAQGSVSRFFDLFRGNGKEQRKPRSRRRKSRR